MSESHERDSFPFDHPRRPSSRNSDQSYGHDVIVVPESFYGQSLVRYVGTLTKYFFNATGNHTAFLDSKIFLPLDICSPLVSAGLLRVKERFEVDAHWNPKKANWIASRIVPVSPNPPNQHQGQDNLFIGSAPRESYSSWEHSVIRAYMDRSRPFNFLMR
jgi:hypothetical protein